MKKKNKKKFAVPVHIDICYHIEVEAKTAEQAIKIVNKMRGKPWVSTATLPGCSYDQYVGVDAEEVEDDA
jgi:hypothetical protein